jgi:ABC-type multidrug transport system permease subunit
MSYSEFLRARTVLVWFAGALLAIMVCNEIIRSLSHVVHAEVHVEGGPSGALPFSIFFAATGFMVAILATVLGTSVNRYREYGETVMTFPTTRRRFASSVLATDVLALAVAFAVSLAFFALQITFQGAWRLMAFDEFLLPRFVICFGAVILWLLLCEAASAGIRQRAGFVAGLSWPLFIGLTSCLGGKANLPAWSRPIVEALNYLNPLTYLSVSINGSHDGPHYMLAQDLWTQALIVWIVSLVAFAIAVAGWQRQEL